MSIGDFVQCNQLILMINRQNKDKLVIKNYTYPSGNSDLTRSTPAQDTDLAAYTVGTKSHVFYQEEDGTLNEYDVQKNICISHDCLFKFKANGNQQQKSTLPLVFERAVRLPPSMTTKLKNHICTM